MARVCGLANLEGATGYICEGVVDNLVVAATLYEAYRRYSHMLKHTILFITLSSSVNKIGVKRRRKKDHLNDDVGGASENDI